MAHNKGMTREFNIDIANWGCGPTNKTALHLADIINKNETQFIKYKLNKVLGTYYNKMAGLIGTGKYQEYYMMLVKEHTLEQFAKLEIASNTTRTHLKSIVVIIYRTLLPLDYDEENPLPRC